ncbi:hypothetical protein [Bradyrhizobium sp. HKCCYLRH3095]|uniref:hypothetical protein n=1 Tax=Bradyrhizobium sp. HKCCYLRH3095 TaxID=3420765 RepID=UPI003EB6B31B
MRRHVFREFFSAAAIRMARRDLLAAVRKPMRRRAAVREGMRWVVLIRPTSLRASQKLSAAFRQSSGIVSDNFDRFPFSAALAI